MAIYYLSPNGSDSNNGLSTGSPFFTLNKAWSLAVSGDTIYMSGGTYAYNSPQINHTKSGVSSYPISVQPYNNQSVVITKSPSFTYDNPDGQGYNLIYLKDVSYNYFENIEISGFTQANSSMWRGFLGYSINNCVFKKLNIHDGGHGMAISHNSSNNYIVNCDFHHNYDPISPTPYESGDGLQIMYIDGDGVNGTNYIHGCRAWSNADDGFDFFNNEGFIVMNNCWSFWNGYKEDGSYATVEGGNGFKLGQALQSSTIKRTLYNCIGFENKTRNLYLNIVSGYHGCAVKICNFTSYYSKTGRGIDLYNTFADLPHIFTNVISYNDFNTVMIGDSTHRANTVVTACNFNKDGSSDTSRVTVNNSSFLSVSSVGMNAVRNSNGDLPVTNFLRPNSSASSTNKIVNKGEIVGLPYYTLPDIGGFEYNDGTPLIATYYISPNGNDTYGLGTGSVPWASLYKACSVATSGSTIHVMAGSYTVTQQCNLAVGVNIDGDGDSLSILNSQVTTPNDSSLNNSTIVLNSSSPGVDGNQYIANIKIDGGYYNGINTGSTTLGHRGILVRFRNKVKIHNCTLSNLFKNGITYYGTSTAHNLYNYNYNTSNEIYDCTIDNCANIAGDSKNWTGGACIKFIGQDGFSVYNCTLNQNSRTLGYNGNILSSLHFKNFKFYNNICRKLDYEGPAGDYDTGLPTGWNFHLEMWNCSGGTEIYNNEFHGGPGPLDLGGFYTFKGSSTFSYSIHDNLFQTISDSISYYISPGVSIAPHGWWPITVEAYQCEDVLIYNNHFKNHPQSIGIGDNWMITTGHFPEYNYNRNYFKNISIYKNLFENTGWRDNTPHSFIEIRAALNLRMSGQTVMNYPTITDNIKFYNNTLKAVSTANSQGLIVYVGEPGHPGGQMSNIDIKNNILCSYNLAAPIWIECFGAGEASITNINARYNLLYTPISGVGFNILPSINPDSTGTITNSVISNNIPTNNYTQKDPLFISSTDYHLSSASPAINAGTNVGLPYSGSAPDMGAFETPTTYYLSPNGSDSNNGLSTGSTWFTLNKAWNYVVSGDTILMSGGTYLYTSMQSLTNKSGISIINYGPTPVVIDSTGQTYPYTLFLENCNYIYIKGITIKNLPMQSGDDRKCAFFFVGVNYCKFEQCNAHHIDGTGFGLRGGWTWGDKYLCTGNEFLNCDSYANYDPLTVTNGVFSPGNNADGFHATCINSASTNTFTGCRAWWNSDDGYDTIENDGIVIWNNCWAMFSGYEADQFTGNIPNLIPVGIEGQGCGWKLSYPATVLTSNIRKLYNCVSYYNGAHGFASWGSHATTSYNCDAIHNGYNLGNGNGYNYNPYINQNHLIKNCIGYDNKNYDMAVQSGSTLSNNAYNKETTYYSYPHISVISSDFANIGLTYDLAGPRNSDGSLPTVTLLHLSSSSNLRNAGVDVGYGNDIGAFAYNVLFRVIKTLNKVLVKNGKILIK